MSPPFAILLAEQAVRQFFKQWNAGLQPCLLLETHASGAIFVSSKVTAGVALPVQTEHVFPPPPHARHPPRQHRRLPGPSRLRRRERRAQARELAAAQAVSKTADPPLGPLEVLLRQIQGRQFVTDTFCPDRDLRRKEKMMKKEEKNEKQI